MTVSHSTNGWAAWQRGLPGDRRLGQHLAATYRPSKASGRAAWSTRCSEAMIAVGIRRESWPIAGTFTTSRGPKTEANVVVVELTDGAARGRGECVPYARYGERVDSVVAEIEEIAADLEAARGRGRRPGRAAAEARVGFPFPPTLTLGRIKLYHYRPPTGLPNPTSTFALTEP